MKKELLYCQETFVNYKSNVIDGERIQIRILSQIEQVIAAIVLFLQHMTAVGKVKKRVWPVVAAKKGREEMSY